jgi:hypothetical protein
LAVANARIALVWFTQAGGSRVQIAWSEDGGKTFGAARRVDSGGALGRVDARADAAGRLLTTWLCEKEGAATWIGRGFSADGTPTRDFILAPATAERAGGILRLAHDAQGWLAAWTEADGAGLRCARIVAPAP